MLPKYPKTIGIITSEAGAAVHDMLRILRKRFPLVKVRLLPVRVQGAEAPGEIASAIYYANRYRLGDLLIVGRGGGSIEDLWAFNDERVARAIYDSAIPVISAVGHEPDVTISDFVADLRAATPSNAAELAVPDQFALRQTLDSVSTAMATALARQLKSCRRQLEVLAGSAPLQTPTQYFVQRRAALDHLKNRLVSAQLQSIAYKKQGYIALTAKLDAMSPLKVLSRGFALAQDENGELIRTVHNVDAGQTIAVTVSDGVIKAIITNKEERFQ